MKEGYSRHPHYEYFPSSTFNPSLFHPPYDILLYSRTRFIIFIFVFTTFSPYPPHQSFPFLPNSFQFFTLYLSPTCLYHILLYSHTRFITLFTFFTIFSSYPLPYSYPFSLIPFFFLHLLRSHYYILLNTLTRLINLFFTVFPLYPPPHSCFFSLIPSTSSSFICHHHLFVP